MKRNSFFVGLMALAFCLVSTAGYAQRGPGMMWRGSGGWGPGTQYNRMYDPKTVETISGEITIVDRITPAKGMSGGVHVNVKTGKETISGASWSGFLHRESGCEAASQRQGRGERFADHIRRQAGDYCGGGEEGRGSVEAA